MHELKSETHHLQVEPVDVAFIYTKDKSFKVLTVEQAKQEHQLLLAGGWSHKSTINTITFIDYLLKSDDDEKLLAINSIIE